MIILTIIFQFGNLQLLWIKINLDASFIKQFIPVGVGLIAICEGMFQAAMRGVSNIIILALISLETIRRNIDFIPETT